jgi:hypothetical protein
MSAALRQWFAAGVAVLLTAGLAPALAQTASLVADCGAPQVIAPSESTARPPRGTTTVDCDMRATDAVVFKSVKASVKDRTGALEAKFTPVDARSQSQAVIFLVQVMEPSRRSLFNDMLDAVVKLAQGRNDMLRFAAYSTGDETKLVADFNASKADFDKQVKAIRAAKQNTQIYKNALDAIARLSREKADRKALVVLGDGTSDDPVGGYIPEQVVKAANDAKVTINAFGYTAENADLPQFQILRRLADDTAGFRKEVRVGSQQRFTPTAQFLSDALSNGGQVKVTLKEPAGPLTIAFTAEFANGKTETVEHSLTVPAPPVAQSPPAKVSPPGVVPPQAWYEQLGSWVRNNLAVAVVLGTALSLGVVGMALFGLSGRNWKGDVVGEPLLDAQGRAAVYGWLDMMDGNASRYPLRTTNVRIGRHRDNDICLQNDSISRRHAVLHFNADSKRFVITDLGGGNGVIVNKIKQQSHDLSDGDLVELGEVRLRFRTNAEAAG